MIFVGHFFSRRLNFCAFWVLKSYVRLSRFEFYFAELGTQVYFLPFTSVKSLTLDLLALETFDSFLSFSGGGVVGVLSVGGVNGVGGSLPSLSDVGLVLPLLIFV